MLTRPAPFSAFPCNQFGSQEPGDDAAIEEFVCKRFKGTFPLMAKIDVNGDNTHPLWAHMKKERTGLLGTKGIKWVRVLEQVCVRGRPPLAVPRLIPRTRPSPTLRRTLQSSSLTRRGT